MNVYSFALLKLMHNAQSEMCTRRDDNLVYLVVDADAKMIMWRKTTRV